MKKKKQRQAAYEVIARSLWFHGGWGVSLERSFGHVPVENPNTMHLADEKTDRSVSLSGYQINRNDGLPWNADDMLATFPPPELSGHRYEHRTKLVSSRGLWMFGDSDNMPSCWLLVALVMSETTPGKGAQVTITAPREADLPWALETWHGILYVPDHDQAPGKAPLKGR